jgi:hypothetical protein
MQPGAIKIVGPTGIVRLQRDGAEQGYLNKLIISIIPTKGDNI